MAYLGRTVLAVVPARSGSKGVPHKNLLALRERSLIGWAGTVLEAAEWVDCRLLSTDSPDYAEEGRRHGLWAPFLRPADLSSDTAGAVDTVTHALHEAERLQAVQFDIVLIVEPTSPLRTADDLRAAVSLLVDSGADSVVTVSRVDPKFHPRKIFRIDGGWMRYYDSTGPVVVNRQELAPLYYRNGLCYALTRETLVRQRRIITDRTVPLVTEREVVNIDGTLDLALAETLSRRPQKSPE